MSSFRMSVLILVPTMLIAAAAGVRVASEPEGAGGEASKESFVKVEYLEIVTDAVDVTCEALGEAQGVTFGEPIAELGNARTADLRGGGRIGVRAPMSPNETPIVRPYALVDNIAAAVKAAEAAGGEIALPPTETLDSSPRTSTLCSITPLRLP